MAKAPRPGIGKRTEEAKTAKVVHRLRIGGETRTIALANVPLKERLIVRKATGLPLEAFLTGDTFGIDSLMIVWWLAGRAAGDAFLTLEKVQDEWPARVTNLEIGDGPVTNSDTSLTGHVDSLAVSVRCASRSYSDFRWVAGKA